MINHPIHRPWLGVLGWWLWHWLYHITTPIVASCCSNHYYRTIINHTITITTFHIIPGSINATTEDIISNKYLKVMLHILSQTGHLPTPIITPINPSIINHNVALLFGILFGLRGSEPHNAPWTRREAESRWEDWDIMLYHSCYEECNSKLCEDKGLSWPIQIIQITKTSLKQVVSETDVAKKVWTWHLICKCHPSTHKWPSVKCPMAFTSTALRNCIKNCGGSDRALALADLVLTFPNIP